MIAYATQPDNVAFDGEGRNNPFSTALVKHCSHARRRHRHHHTAGARRRRCGDAREAGAVGSSSLIGDVILVK
jgi:hypothetical protein